MAKKEKIQKKNPIACFAEELCKKRKEKQYSQQKVAAKTGFHTQAISNYERGLVLPPQNKKTIKLLQTLDISVDDYIDLVLENQRNQIRWRLKNHN